MRIEAELSEMCIECEGGIKLIYIDPPFDVGTDFSMNIEIGGEELTKKPNILEELAYHIGIPGAKGRTPLLP